jgi:nucleoside-diphosphate-sugar epimerase
MKHDAVLIVGANGFLGKRLIAYLLEKGYTNIIGVGISALSVSNLRSFIDCDDALPDSIIRRIKYYNADIRKPGALKDVLSTRNFKSIINLTPFSDTTFFNSEPNFNIQSMLGEGFRSIINYSHVNNILLIQMSTAILYKGAQNKLNNENSEIDPFQNSYTEAKRVMELVSMNSGVKTVIFRCANMYGEGDKPKKVVPLFIKKAKQGLVLFASNDVKEFIHVEDVADAIERVLCRKIPTGITNLGSGEKISIRNLAEKIKDFANTPKNIIKSHVILSDKSGFMKVMDSSMFRECSGWQSQKSLDDGLKKLVSKF